MLKQIGISTNEIYQSLKDSLKEDVWNCFRKAAMAGAFRRATHHSITKKVSKLQSFIVRKFGKAG